MALLAGCQSAERLHIRHGIEIIFEERVGKEPQRGFPAAFPTQPPPGYQGAVWPPRTSGR